ncbi:MAG: prevent-host-death protein [Dissulfurimicrobium sp.]|uniref:prevent-host-death protein n=1 Tax=Dissulfurimicrobium TaxID=1769732 RepID=UPI002ED59E62
MDTIFADITVSVTELNRNSRAFSNRPANAYRHLEPQPARGLPVSHYEWPMAYIEDLEDANLVRERENGPFV